MEGDPDAVVAVKLLVPTVDMYVSRSDAIETRMIGCILVEQARSFVEPLQHIKAATHSLQADNLVTLFTRSIGGVQVRNRTIGEA